MLAVMDRSSSVDIDVYTYITYVTYVCNVCCIVYCHVAQGHARLRNVVKCDVMYCDAMQRNA